MCEQCKLLRDDIAISRAMHLAGVEAYAKWNESEEDVEALIVSMFYSMVDAMHEASKGPTPSE